MSPSHTSSYTKDCRWKRGQAVLFSSRTFSTNQADLDTQAWAVKEDPVATSIAEQTPEQSEAAVPHYSADRYTNDGVVSSEQQDGSVAVDEPQLCHPAPIQTDSAIGGASREGCVMNAISTPPTDIYSADCDERNAVAPGFELNGKLASPKDSTTDQVTDGDYADESATQSDKDVTDFNGPAEEPIETHEPLTFQIPEDILRATIAAPENSKASFWSSNLYRGPEDKRILVHYCKTNEVAERVAQHFLGEKVVGFDIEWKPWAHAQSIKKNVSLIQLACEDRIALFHIALFPGQTAAQLMPPTLKSILESPEVYKVGVAVKGDFSRIIKFLDVEPQGVFELSRLHNLVEFSAIDPSKITNKLVGLATQVQQHLQLPLYKGGELVDDPEDTYNVRSSDWSLSLNLQQIHYAAADAYAGFRLYDVLENKRKQLKPTPPRPLLCDYDSKRKPKPSNSKPRKKRSPAAKTDEVLSPAKEETSALEELEVDLELEEELKQSQDTEGYETAQEELLDSHQLEGEGPVALEEINAPNDGIERNTSIESTPSLESNLNVAPAACNQRRVGRINLDWLKGPEPRYPILQQLHVGDTPSTTFSEDLVDTSVISDNDTSFPESSSVENSEAEEETDEFDDSELEEALQNLDINSKGEVQADTVAVAKIEPASRPEDTLGVTSPATEADTEDDDAESTSLPSSTVGESACDKEEQHLIDLVNDPSIVGHPHTPAHPLPAADPPLQTHTHEYDLATTWAQSYLASTIPSPSSRTPSHIRATITHLRAYNMWHQQGLSLGVVARHLRDPPLAESTVGNYVLQAITLERMEYDTEAVKEVLMGMPESLRKGKWRGLAEKVGAR